MSDVDEEENNEAGLDPTPKKERSLERQNQEANLFDPIEDLACSEIRDVRSVPSSHSRKAKRLKGLYNDEYRQLFNRAVFEINFGDPQNDHRSLKPTQIGVSYWTCHEKESFFTALARHGKDAIPEITAAVQSKSVAQVREYLLLLQSGFREYSLNSRYYNNLESVASFPAAVEVSRECEDALNIAGEAIALHEEKISFGIEKKRHEDLWLLDRDIADQIEEIVKQRDPSKGELKSKGKALNDPANNDVKFSRENLVDSIPASRLLRLRNWLLLSDRIFMNSGESAATDNWRKISDPSEPPSIFNTAFTDFHRLAVSITKRVVQAALFQAMLRVRAENWRTSHQTQPSVRKQDIRLALKILGMKENSKEFWAKSVRKCGVNVYIDPPLSDSTTIAQQSLDYDEVESRLLGLKSPTVMSPIPPALVLKATSEVAVPDAREQDVVLEDSSESSESSESYSRDATPDSMLSSALEPPSHRTQRAREKEEDAYADMLDIKSARAEERMLRSVVQLSHSNCPSPIEEDPPKVYAIRKSIEDLTDWREKLDFHPEWEVYGTSLHHKILSTNKTKVNNIAYQSRQDTTQFYQASVDHVPRETPSRKRKLSRSESSERPSDHTDTDAVMSDASSRRRTLLPRKSREQALRLIEGTEYRPRDHSTSEDDFDPTL